MPFLSTAIAVATLATSAVGVGESIYSAVSGGPSMGKPSDKPTPLTANQNLAQQQAVTSQLPNLQALTGGALSPEYAALFGATSSGLGNDPQATGNIQAAINKYFGLNAPGDKDFVASAGSPTSGSNYGLLDLFRGIPPSPSGTATAPRTGGADFIGPEFNSDLFKGLVV